eukprot:1367893-Amorphochlora_amoeboformis.AAC.2
MQEYVLRKAWENEAIALSLHADRLYTHGQPVFNTARRIERGIKRTSGLRKRKLPLQLRPDPQTVASETTSWSPVWGQVVAQKHTIGGRAQKQKYSPHGALILEDKSRLSHSYPTLPEASHLRFSYSTLLRSRDRTFHRVVSI